MGPRHCRGPGSWSVKSRKQAQRSKQSRQSDALHSCCQRKGRPRSVCVAPLFKCVWLRHLREAVKFFHTMRERRFWATLLSGEGAWFTVLLPHEHTDRATKTGLWHALHTYFHRDIHGRREKPRGLYDLVVDGVLVLPHLLEGAERRTLVQIPTSNCVLVAAHLHAARLWQNPHYLLAAWDLAPQRTLACFRAARLSAAFNAAEHMQADILMQPPTDMVLAAMRALLAGAPG